ncbi:MAG: Holliday junction branch migration protein RuvA [Bacteroidales bacterium]|nr:Holliday junction branch migration protein RuvA [Bacteroidales bacterium]
MIEYIKGEVITLTPTNVVLENQGLAYFINISLNTYTNIQTLKTCKLYIHEAIREDAYVLFGFSTLSERTTFQQLIGVSGVGANTARMILSSLSVIELETCILSENVDALKAVKGIGLKTAQRIIVDLKDKMGKAGVVASETMATGSKNSLVRDEAVAALQMLGFVQSASMKVVCKILSDFPNLPVEQVIKAALKLL